MNNIAIIEDSSEFAMILKTRAARNTIGKALGRAYPTHPWFVHMSDDGTVAQVTCPAISSERGMVIHVNSSTQELERKAVQFGGELLERYRVSRTAADFSGLTKDRRGNAIGGT